MLVIRLARGGRHKYPTYRIVAAESARAATGKFVEILGHYNPHTKELVIKKDETVARLNNGAQPSNTVIKLLQREKIELPKWVELKTKAPKPKEVAKEEPKAEAKTEESADVSADEAAADANTEPPVAVAATENEAANEDKAPDPGSTETTEITEKAAEAAVKTEDAGVETPAPEPDKASK